MRSLPAVALTLVVSGCAGDDHGSDEVDCTKVSGADEFVVGLAKPGSAGMFGFQMMSADPAPPARGDNTWVVQINDQAGTPLDGLTVVATPFMPAHQHGTPITVKVTPVGVPGQYTLTPVNLWMPGVWETTVRGTSTTANDSAVFTFCIN